MISMLVKFIRWTFFVKNKALPRTMYVAYECASCGVILNTTFEPPLTFKDVQGAMSEIQDNLSKEHGPKYCGAKKIMVHVR